MSPQRFLSSVPLSGWLTIPGFLYLFVKEAQREDVGTQTQSNTLLLFPDFSVFYDGKLAAPSSDSEVQSRKSD